jgi:hypothetical protein
VKISIINLRKARESYDLARSIRYRELVDWNAYDDDAFEKHKKVIEQINLEESALLMEWPEEKSLVTCGPVVNSKGEFAKWVEDGWQEI